MYYIIKGIEYIASYIRIKCKIFYWKLKYGKRIKIGKNLKFRKRFNINIASNGYLEIGDNNFFNNDCSINCHKSIIIGNDNLFGESVKLYDHNHIFNDKSINIKKSFKEGKIEIGNYNWLSSNVILLNNTQITDYNVVAAGCIGKINLSESGYLIRNNKIEKIDFKEKEG